MTRTISPALLSRVPARLRPHVTDIYRDSDGLWIEGDRYFWNPCYDCHTVHEDNWAQARVILRECKVLPEGHPECHD